MLEPLALEDDGVDDDDEGDDDVEGFAFRGPILGLHIRHSPTVRLFVYG